MKYAPYSHSKISSYETCPQKFKFKYIDKIPVERIPFKHLDRGKFIHALFEHDGDMKKIQQTRDWREIKEHKLLTKDDIKESVKLYKDFKEKHKSLFRKKFILREFPMGLTKDLEITDYGASDAILRGYTDAAAVDEKTNTLILIDYKTGKKPQEQSWAQLLWYGMGFFSKLPFDKILMVFAYIDTNELVTKPIYRKNLNKYKTEMFKKILKIEKDTEFPKEESGLCDFCDYRELCL